MIGRILVSLVVTLATAGEPVAASPHGPPPARGQRCAGAAVTGGPAAAPAHPLPGTDPGGCAPAPAQGSGQDSSEAPGAITGTGTPEEVQTPAAAGSVLVLGTAVSAGLLRARVSRRSWGRLRLRDARLVAARVLRRADRASRPAVGRCRRTAPGRVRCAVAWVGWRGTATVALAGARGRATVEWYRESLP